MAAEDDDLFKSCAVICICNRLRQDLNPEGDGERKHKSRAQ